MTTYIHMHLHFTVFMISADDLYSILLSASCLCYCFVGNLSKGKQYTQKNSNDIHARPKNSKSKYGQKSYISQYFSNLLCRH